jgi:hypothetical protein
MGEQQPMSIQNRLEQIGVAVFVLGLIALVGFGIFVFVEAL